jgi:hypothetical protein
MYDSPNSNFNRQDAAPLRLGFDKKFQAHSRMISLAMTTIDPAGERRRLTNLYSAMTDGELEQIGEDASALTDAAREVLSAELSRRNLPAITSPQAEDPEVEVLDLVTIRQFRDLPEAILARGILESAEIETFFADENIVRMDWFISNAVGGIKLKVRKEDVEAANEALNAPVSEDSSEPDED